MAKEIKQLFGSSHGLDEKSIDFLTKALEKSNLPGFDYIEFKQSLSALSKMNMDEETAIKSAFATASTMGLSKEKLIKTAAHYVKVLQKEKSQFDAALQKQLKQKVQAKRDEVEKMKVEIEKNKEKIDKLKALIIKQQDTIDHADENIQEAQNKIETTKENFEFTYTSILNQIKKDVDNIEQFL